MTGKIKMSKGVRKATCARCDQSRLPTSRYCSDCKNTYMREWRKSHPQTPEQKFRALVRAKTKMRIRRGLLIKYPCEFCDATERVEAHHRDYNKPYEVMWLCFACHRAHHKTLGLLSKAKRIQRHHIVVENIEKFLSEE